MNFRNKRGGLFYGFVKGTSMWPEFIPRDILRARAVTAEALAPGDIIVISHNSPNPVVHRCIAKSMQDSDTILLHTAGDRSGSDSPLTADPEKKFLRVIGVLRKGLWMKPGREPFAHAEAVPDCIVRLHCRIVRKFFW
ncbi:MAG: S24/S26 family peptidase [Candidatus Fermentibacteria bacterium]